MYLCGYGGSLQSNSSKDQWHFPARTCSKWDKPMLDSALKWGKERLLLFLSLLYQFGMSAPLPLVTTFIVGAY